MVKELVLALGANVDAKENMEQARHLLKELVQDLRCSTSVWTQPIGIVSKPFLNCVATGTCHIEYSQLRDCIKAIERECGNSTARRKRGEIAMDIDVLFYDGKRYHTNDWNRDYIKRGIEELFSNNELR